MADTNFVSIIKEKLKNYAPISRKRIDEIVAQAYEKGVMDERAWKRIDASSLDISEISPGSKIYNDLSFGSGFQKELSSINRKDIIKDLGQLGITEQETEFWQQLGWFSKSETEQYYSREQNEGDLFSAQDACYLATWTDPHLKALLSNITNYICGEGIKFSVPNDKVQEYLDEFWYDNKIDLYQKSYVFNTLQLGELFWGLYTEPGDGRVSLRKYETYEVTDIEVGGTDRNILLAYEYTPAGLIGGKTKWIADYEYFKQLERKSRNSQVSKHSLDLDEYSTIMFVRHNLGSEVRGRVPFAGALKYLRMARDFVFVRFLLNNERSKILWLRVVPRINASRIAEYKPLPYSTSLDLPYGKIMNVYSKDEIQVVNANIDAADALPDYLNILYMAAAEAQVPLIIIDQRASEEVYASMKRSANPFHQMIEAERAFFGFYLGRLLNYVLEQGVKAGRLKDKYKITLYKPYSDEEKPYSKLDFVNTTRIPIRIIFPEVFTEDPLNQSRSDALMLDRGVISRETVASRNMLNYAEEKAKMAQFGDDEFFKKDKDTGNGNPSRVGLDMILAKLEELEEKMQGLEKVKK